MIARLRVAERNFSKVQKRHSTVTAYELEIQWYGVEVELSETFSVHFYQQTYDCMKSAISMSSLWQKKTVNEK